VITADTTPVALAALSDYSTFPPAPNGVLAMDITPRRITGAAVVVEWVARAWLTTRGALQYAPGLGADIRDMENATLDLPAIARWRSVLIAQARQRPFVADALVAVTFDPVARTTTIDGRLVLVDGKAYPLMVSILAASKVILTLATG